MKIEFSKSLLKQESALIWIITLAFIALAFICVLNRYIGELPWLTTMVAFPWTAYGVSQAAYYRKAAKENTVGGVKYESVLRGMEPEPEEDEYIDLFGDEPIFVDEEEEVGED
jgi:positive regulator of sigma E activity